MVKSAKDRVIEERKAKRSLGIAPSMPLPRCGHWSKARAQKIADETGDMSHFEPNHVCDECKCLRVAGSGTNHLGVGWCHSHEVNHSNRNCRERVEAMTAAIRKGYPMDVVELSKGGQFLEKINTDAQRAIEQVTLKKELGNIRLLGDTLMKHITDEVDEKTGKTKSGIHQFTESYKEGPGQASDATLYALYAKMTDSISKLAKVELEISDLDYVHWDDVRIYFAKLANVVSKMIEDDGLMNRILMEWATIPEPGSGRKKKRR